MSGQAGAPAGRIAFVDAAAGLAGDMLLGALVDAGLPLSVLTGVVEALGLAGVSVRATRVRRGPLAATLVEVLVDGVVAEHPAEQDHEHEHGQGDGHEPPHAEAPGRAPLPAPGASHGHPHAHLSPAGGAANPQPHPAHAQAPTPAGAPPRVRPAALHGVPPGPGQRHGHRTLAEVLERIDASVGLPAAALADARRVFSHLAQAEGRVHGVPAQEVHFHEVGALDALVDVVGACVGLRALGVTEVRVSPLPWPAGGSVRTSHGALALPPPAVAELLVGHPVVPSPETFEQVTPTGAALMRALSAGSCVPVGFVPRAVGWGAGARDQGRLPNAVRLVVGEAGEGREAAEAVLLETNLDDATGQQLAVALAKALEAGALDAWVTAVTMKKGRPGHVLSALARPEDVARLEALLFRETPTLGVRRHAVARHALARRHVEVATPWGPVRMKVRDTPEGPEATPEHEDCRRLAEAHGIALSRVEDAARRGWAR